MIMDKFVRSMLKIFHIELSKKHEDLFIQIFKFAIVGGTAFIIDFAFLYTHAKARICNLFPL